MDRIWRRDFFGQVGGGLCGAALLHRAGLRAAAESNSPSPSPSPTAPARYDLTPKSPPHYGRATAVIHLFMNGGPSQMDLLTQRKRWSAIMASHTSTRSPERSSFPWRPAR